MENEVLKMAMQQGMWAVLFVVLLFYVLKEKEDFNFWGHSFQWAKENCGLIAFPPITGPGHVRKAFEDAITNLNVSNEEKAQISFGLTTAYGKSIKNNSNNLSNLYSNQSMSDTINNLLRNNENYKKFNPDFYNNTKLVLYSVMNAL